MTSERLIARGFNSFWSELFPLLTPDFVRLFNVNYVERGSDSLGFPLRLLPLSEEVRHYDVVSEVSFYLAASIQKLNIDALAAVGNSALCEDAIARARISLMPVYSSASKAFDLTQAEWDEIIRLLQRYPPLLRAEETHPGLVEFEPSFAGVGFLDNCRGDVAIGNTLYEVKTVDRGIHSQDFRQLYLYFTLQAATGDRRWSRGGFLNPRRGVFCSFDIENFTQKISGGRSSGEVLAEIMYFLTNRDLVIDQRF